MNLILAAALLSPLIQVLIAVLVGVIILYCVGLFIPDSRIRTVVSIIIGLIILVYALGLFGIRL